MRQFANIYLILFLADGAISTLDELLAAVSGVHVLAQVRNMGALPVLLLSVPLFVAMGVDRRIPKKIFLPMVLYALWAPLMFWPMPLFIPPAAFGFLMSLGQLVLGLAGLRAVRRLSDDHGLLMSPSMFSGPWFGWKHSLGFFSLSAVLVPVTLAVIGFWFLSTLVEAKTHGFMKIRPSGLYMTEKIYGKDGKTLRLIPMIHIGRTDYYDDVGGSMTNGKTLILAEGVSDREGLLNARFSYDKVGELLGLATQDVMPMDGTFVSSDFIPLESAPEQDDPFPHIVSADLDLSAFAPVTVEFLEIITTAFFSGGPIADGYNRYAAWVKAQGDEEETFRIITHDIFTQRNEAVFAMMEKALPHYDTLIVPWGALHMAEIEKEAQRLGFFQLGEKERLSVDFGEAAKHLQKERGKGI